MLPSPSIAKREESSSPRGADGDYKDESPELDTVLQVQAGRIIARVNIEGQLFNATIDTGASRSFVSERVIQQCGRVSLQLSPLNLGTTNLVLSPLSTTAFRQSPNTITGGQEPEPLDQPEQPEHRNQEALGPINNLSPRDEATAHALRFAKHRFPKEGRSHA